MFEFFLLTIFGLPEGGDHLKISEEKDIGIFETHAIPQKISRKISPIFDNNPNLTLFAQDIRSKKILYTESPNASRNIASLTKLMVYAVIIQNHNLQAKVPIAVKAAQATGASGGFFAGEVVNVQTLLEALLIPSANDAALALAIFDSGSEEDFVVKMNDLAQKWGLNSAKFYNSTGLDIYDAESSEYIGNTMSARDVSRLVHRLLKDDFFRSTVQKPHFFGTSADGEFFHEKPSTNQLLSLPRTLNYRVLGVKTGYTFLAGQCLVSLVQIDNEHEILIVILSSGDRFDQTKQLIEWVISAWKW